MRGGGRARSVVTVHAGRDATAQAYPYPGRSPVLVLELASALVMIGTHYEDRVTATDVAFARQLAAEAQAFAVACERMFHGLPNGRGMRAS